MSKDKDYIWVKGKLPTKDKNGNDITSDKIGKGGYHRADGTFSGLVRDIEPLDKTTAKIKEPPPTKKQDNQLAKKQDNHKMNKQDKSSANKQIKNQPDKGGAKNGLKERIIEEVAYKAIDLAFYGIKCGVASGFNFIKRKFAERKATKSDVGEHVNEDDVDVSENTYGADVDDTTAIVNNDEIDPIDVACQNYIVNMTSEEAQKELLDAFILRLLSERKLWKLSHAKVTDSDGNITDIQAMIEKLTAPKLLDNINNILSNNIALLEAWQMAALKDILERELIQNGDFIPIESESLKKNLTSI